MPRHAECARQNLLLRHFSALCSTMRTRTSNKAAIAAAVVASLHSLGDGGAVVSAFVVPTGGRAHLASEASASRMMFSLQEVADVGRRLASGGGTVAVGGGGGGEWVECMETFVIVIMVLVVVVVVVVAFVFLLVVAAVRVVVVCVLLLLLN